MKKPVLIYKSFIVTIIFLCFSHFMYSSNVPCPSGSLPWITKTASIEMGKYGPGGNVSYKYRNNMNGIEIILDWSTMQNLSDFISNTSMKKMLESEAVREAVAYSNETEGDARVYFTVDCFARVKIAIKLDRTIQVACCDEGLDISDEIQSRWNGSEEEFYYNIYKNIKCGEKCCARVYHWEKVWDNIENKLITVVNPPTTEAIFGCGGNSQYTDCITGDPIPCESVNCDVW